MDEELDLLASRQYGLIDREQAVLLGLSPREIDHRVRHGDWIRLFPNVYRTAPMPTAESAARRVRIRAAVLWLGPNTVLAGFTAAWWHQLMQPRSSDFELVVGDSRRVRKQPGVQLIRGQLDPRDVERRSGLLVCTVERTALELAAVGCTDLLDLLIRQGTYDAEAILAVLARGRGQRGWREARRSVEESASRPFSAAERILHRLLRVASLTGWHANVRLRIGGRTVVPDILFPMQRLVIEVDGRGHHSHSSAFESDRSRQNLLVAAGYTVLRFTWHQLVDDPDAVIRQILATLGTLAAANRRI